MANEEVKIPSFKRDQEIRNIAGRITTQVISPIGDPADKPKQGIEQQMRMVVDSLTAPTARRLYIYNFELDDWLYVTLST